MITQGLLFIGYKISSPAGILNAQLTVLFVTLQHIPTLTFLSSLNYHIKMNII
jgi:hypothetical protein